MTAATYNIYLVVASVAVSLVAAFTGLALTNNVAGMPESRRKVLVAISSVILGSGIWSMHFVAMLAHEVNVPVYYDLLETLSSVLIAILVIGVALLMLHFFSRTPLLLNSAGTILGLGIIAMHYVGMLAVRGVTPQFSVIPTLLAILVAALAGVVAIRVAYGHRTKQNIIYGAVVFGLAVAAVHYTAMIGTTFQIDESFQPAPAVMASHSLAITVTVAAFVICGTFLLAATTFLTHSRSGAEANVTADKPADAAIHSGVDNSAEDPISSHAAALPTEVDIPFEKNKKILLLGSSNVGAIRADGHYTHLYTKEGVLF